MKVGYRYDNYAVRRNILRKIPEIKYQKLIDIRSILSNIFYKVYSLFKEISHKSNKTIFKDYGFNNTDLNHFFNTVSSGPTPWITTFETILPRSDQSHKRFNELTETINPELEIALKQLAAKPCKKLIALSKCNLKMQEGFLNFFPKYSDKILPKLICIHPPQKIFLKTWIEKDISEKGTLKLMMVGGLFFFKGGREILSTLDQLVNKEKLDIHLTLISSLSPDEFASNTTLQDREIALNFINYNKHFITHYNSLPNDKVLKLMKKQHIGLLPSYGDTYGYSVLEFQSMGCPVITTDIRAFPEINNNNHGWIIEVPKNKHGGALYSSEETRLELSKTIVAGLKHHIKHIYQHRKEIINKGNKSIEHIKTNHCPKKFAASLKKIYEGALY